MSNSNQLWDLFYHPAHPCMIIMMYMSWSNSTINSSNRNSIWNIYHMSIIELVVGMLLQN